MIWIDYAIIGLVFIDLITLIVGSLIRIFLGKSIKKIKLTFTDRLGGIVFMRLSIRLGNNSLRCFTAGILAVVEYE